MNPFEVIPNSKKMLTVVGLYVGVVSQIFVSVSFSGILPLAALDFPDGANWPLAVSISGILGICVMPVYGIIGAKSPSVKRPLVAFSLVVGAAVLLLRGFAPSMMVMILVSVFWGLVSASIYVLGFTMVRDMFDQQRSGTYLGIFGSMVSLGMLIGPFLAGFLMDNFGWRPPLLLAGGLMAVAALLVFFGAKITKQEAAPLAVNTGRFDLVGALLVSVFLACLIVALSMTSFFPLGSTVSNILFTVAAVCLVGFVVDIAKKKDAAFVPVKVFRDRNSVVFSVCNFLASFSVMSVTVFIPAFIRASMTQDPIVMAIGISLASLLPQALQAVIGLALGAVLGKAIAKSGNARGVLTLGTIVRLLVYVGLLLTLWGVFGPANYIVICVFAFLLGIAIIQQSVTYSAGPQLQIGQDLRVQSNSIIQLGQNLGAGVAVPVYTMCIAFATAPFIQQGVDQQAASAMGIVNALPVMLIIGIVAIVVLLFVGLMLRPLPAKGEHGSDE